MINCIECKYFYPWSNGEEGECKFDFPPFIKDAWKSNELDIKRKVLNNDTCDLGKK